MAQKTDTLTLDMKDVMRGLTLQLRMPRSFSIRTRIACWLIGLAGRLITVPVDIEMRDDILRTGDVVQPSPSRTTSPRPRKPIG